MPLLRAHMYRQHPQFWCAPTVDDRDSWIPSMRHIAVEGRCFVLSACQYLADADGPPRIRGGSVIVDPFGVVLAGPNYSGECVLTAELNLDRIVEGKFDLDVAGHYARPDLFRLDVG
jgi:nitrilase